MCHSMGFIHYTYTMQGRYEDVLKITSRRFDLNIPRPTAKQVSLKFFTAQPLVQFARWKEILEYPRETPGKFFNSMEKVWANGMAHAAMGNPAQADSAIFQLAICKDSILERIAGDKKEMNFILNAEKIMKNNISAKIACGKKDYKKAITHLRLAVIAEDSFQYSEPPRWWVPSRETLGATFLLDGNYTEAERTFKEELKKHPNNPRALFGLSKSLELRGKKKEAKIIEKKFNEYWKYADVKLSIEDL